MARKTEAPAEPAAAAKEFRALHRYARTTARKARLVADLIRGQDVNRALETLHFCDKRAASFWAKVLRSAVANASQDEAVDVNRLFVCDARADDGPLVNNRLRWRPGPQGRAMPIRKRTSHLSLALSERAE
jgi:large subunit ribosomal protein L22